MCVCVIKKEYKIERKKERVIDRQMIDTENEREIKTDKERGRKRVRFGGSSWFRGNTDIIKHILKILN